MSKKNKRKTKLMVEVFTGGLPIFLYTDGVPEATNGSEELYGSERMLAVKLM